MTTSDIGSGLYHLSLTYKTVFQLKLEKFSKEVPTLKRVLS